MVILIGGCSGFDTVSDTDGGGDTFIELDVEPETADIFIDGDYRGTVDGWHHRMVPVEPGHRRLKLDADGHVPQRLDVDIDEGRSVTVRVRLESSISTPDDAELDDDGDPRDLDESETEDDGLTPPDHPTVPE